MRRGSSSKVFSGDKGVLKILFVKSSKPPKGSITFPKSFSIKEIAKAFTVKSLLFWSSSMLPGLTDGFLLSLA